MKSSMSVKRRNVWVKVMGGAALLAVACAPEYPAPPATARGDVVDTIHGEAIPDPYRWLEAQDDPATRDWIDRQNAYAERIIGEPAMRDQLRARLRELMDVDWIGPTQKGGGFEYFTMRRAGRELATIYRRKAPEKDALIRIEPDEDYELVLDPHDMSLGRTTRVDILSVHRDGELLLYSIRDGGQDEIEIRVREVDKGVDLPERLPRGLYASIAFAKDGSGFYYTRRSRTYGPRVLFHHLGTDIEDDVELFGDEYGPTSFINISELDEGGTLVYTVNHGWSRSELHLGTRSGAEDPKPIVMDVDARFYPRIVNGELFVRTNLDAPNNKIVAIDPENPLREAWRDIIPESDDVLQDFTVIGEKLYLTYLHDASASIRAFSLDGTAASEVAVPDHHSAKIRGAGEGKALLTIESFLQPETTYLVDLETGARELWRASEVPFDSAQLLVEQVRYPSKDGTEIPIYLVHAADPSSGKAAPTLLFGYGGFNAAQTPRFDAVAAAWVEHGGIFALANLRGGSEYGERWHRSGMLENKQNVFDDFLAASEWLIASGYTRSDLLAIRGVSNGGLLVASAFTQRPDLFRAVLCGFPDLDMVRFNTFTEINNLPALLEYGDAAIPEQFAFLRKYSPYQAVSDGTRYPAVMLTSGDLDTRVAPLQARKMTARIQNATASGLPVILRYHEKAGHAASYGLPISQIVELRAAELTFLFTQLGVTGSQ